MSQVQVEYPLSEVLGMTSILGCRFWDICVYTHNELSQRWAPSLNTKLIYISYTPLTHSLKVIFCDHFTVHVLTVASHMKSAVEFSTSWLHVGAQKVLDLEIFWIF